MIESVKKKNDENGNWANSYILTLTNGEMWDVPHETDNRHYQAIQEWVAEGNKIEDAD
tara:strand:- start:113 stop:286 length:174 start_codon:yes stop_codon:yes gene_type:complete